MKLRSRGSGMALVLTRVSTTVQTGIRLDQDHLGLLLTARVPSEYFIFRQGVATGDPVTGVRAWFDRKVTDSL